MQNQEQILNVVFKVNDDGLETCEVRAPGDRETVKVFPAHAEAGWVLDDNGDQVNETYAQRWNKQYLRFKENRAQTQDGTPLTDAPFITQMKANELRALGFHVLEQVAAAEGRNLKMIGQGGRDLKEKAAEFLSGKDDREVDALRKRIADLEGAKTDVEPVDDVRADDETAEKNAIKSEIADLTGARPKGNPSLDTLRETLADLKA